MQGPTDPLSRSDSESDDGPSRRPAGWDCGPTGGGSGFRHEPAREPLFNLPGVVVPVSPLTQKDSGPRIPYHSSELVDRTDGCPADNVSAPRWLGR